jgi:hypothetical protein
VNVRVPLELAVELAIAALRNSGGAGIELAECGAAGAGGAAATPSGSSTVAAAPLLSAAAAANPDPRQPCSGMLHACTGRPHGGASPTCPGCPPGGARVFVHYNEKEARWDE